MKIGKIFLRIKARYSQKDIDEVKKAGEDISEQLTRLGNIINTAGVSVKEAGEIMADAHRKIQALSKKEIDVEIYEDKEVIDTTSLDNNKENRMTIAYIAHPISGDVTGNLENIKRISRAINLNEPDVVPFAPYFLDCYSLDDGNSEERLRGIKNDKEFFKRGIIDELRLYGNNISSGMIAEIKQAKELGIPVKPMSKATIHKYKLLKLEKGWKD